MIEVDRNTTLNLRGDPEVMLEYLKLSFKDRWMKNVNENLKKGYNEMSQINLTLAEIGLEDDMTDLHMYEKRLTGRDQR
ncbi:MAG: CopG family transcriptional regulator [Tissierellia bacterium]|nr:CopG family transcriptional regulator [Tissierellia bacterium]